MYRVAYKIFVHLLLKMAKCRASEPKNFARCAREAQKVEIAVLGVKMVQLLAARPELDTVSRRAPLVSAVPRAIKL